MAQDMPPVPPEAEVIKLARMAARLTPAEAAAKVRAAGGKISDTYWRDIERGHGGRRGKRVPARASDGLLAQMAYAAGVTPAQLAGAGRGDAARVLEAILRREQPPVPPPLLTAGLPSPDGHAPAIPRSPDDTVQQMLRGVAGAWEQVKPYYEQVARRAAPVIADLGGAMPLGALVFSQPGEQWLAAEWDSLAGKRKEGSGTLWTADDVVTGVAVRLLQAAAARQQNPGTASAGLTPHITESSRCAGSCWHPQVRRLVLERSRRSLGNP